LRSLNGSSAGELNDEHDKMENTPFQVSNTDRTHVASRRLGPFSKELIEAVRTVSRIEYVAGQYVHLRQSGSQLIGRCPFHSDRTPSFAVSPDKQLFRCHGCGVGGDVFTFVREQAKCSFADAVKLLAQRAGITVEGFQPSAELLAKVDAIKKQRDEEEHFQRLCSDRLEAIGRKYRSLGRAATHAENYLLFGRNDPHIEELAWGALKRYRDYEACVEREELCDSNVLREEWLAKKGSYVAA
jgi:hypothetical protein